MDCLGVVVLLELQVVQHLVNHYLVHNLCQARHLWLHRVKGLSLFLRLFPVFECAQKFFVQATEPIILTVSATDQHSEAVHEVHDNRLALVVAACDQL